MPPVYPRPYGRGIARAAPGLFFWKRSAPPRTLIVVAIHPRAYARGILAHASKKTISGTTKIQGGIRLVFFLWTQKPYAFKSAMTSSTSLFSDACGRTFGLLVSVLPRLSLGRSPERLPPSGSLIFKFTRALFFIPTTRRSVLIAFAVLPIRPMIFPISSGAISSVSNTPISSTTRETFTAPGLSTRDFTRYSRNSLSLYVSAISFNLQLLNHSEATFINKDKNPCPRRHSVEEQMQTLALSLARRSNLSKI